MFVLSRAFQAIDNPAARPSSPTQGSLTSEQLQWLVSEAQALIDPHTGTMPRGGWKQISEGLASRFGVIKTRKAVMTRYYTAVQHEDKREYSAFEVQAILRGVNKVLASEGKPPLASLTIPSMSDFLGGRFLPDGTPWRLVSGLFCF